MGETRSTPFVPDPMAERRQMCRREGARPEKEEAPNERLRQQVVRGIEAKLIPEPLCSSRLEGQVAGMASLRNKGRRTANYIIY